MKLHQDPNWLTNNPVVAFSIEPVGNSLVCNKAVSGLLAGGVGQQAQAKGAE